MSKWISTAAAAAAMAGLTLGAGCGGGGQELDDSPEAQAFVFRQAVMQVTADKMLTIGAMARGEIPVDEAVFTKSASDLATMAGMATEGFMPEGIPPGSRAEPEIWSNWSDFEARAQDFHDAAQAVAEAAQNGGFESAESLVRPLQRTCGGCHNTYRASEE